MSKSKELAMGVFEKAKQVRFHYLQHKKAYEALTAVEAQKGKTGPALKKICDDYANDRFGSKKYAPWLYVYSAMNGVFREGWIPDDYFTQYMVPTLQGSYGQISFLKPMTKNLFHSDLFPDIGSFVNGIFLDNDLKVIPESNVADYLFQYGDTIVYKKDEAAYQGLGVYFFNKDNFSAKTIKQYGNGVFQEFIEQHPFFTEIVPGAVATIRLTTVLDGRGEVSVRSSILRVGRSAESHVKAKTEIRTLADIKTGELSSAVYLPNFQVISRHPDTNYDFAGKYLPFYDKCVDAVCGLHQMLPQVRCIGWDVVVDKNERVRIMEWNGAYNGVKLAEAMQGPCFADLGWDKLHLLKSNPDWSF